MAKKFSKTWRKSTQARKQHKYKHNAPLHIRQKMVHVHLSLDLRKSYSFRNIQVKKGDKVKVLCGHFKKKEGAVEKVDLKGEKIFISGVEYIKKDGTKIPLGLHPSNLMIISLNQDDKKRKAKLESKKQSTKGIVSTKNPAGVKSKNKKSE